MEPEPKTKIPGQLWFRYPNPKYPTIADFVDSFGFRFHTRIPIQTRIPDFFGFHSFVFSLKTAVGPIGRPKTGPVRIELSGLFRSVEFGPFGRPKKKPGLARSTSNDNTNFLLCYKWKHRFKIIVSHSFSTNFILFQVYSKFITLLLIIPFKKI